MNYGLDKVFCRQFYAPAPNILFTPFGNLDKDILYWSTMGVSPVYSITIGGIEVLAAGLLLFRRTRFVGLVIAIVSLLHIVLINFAFDISVKLFSLLLLAMALYAGWGKVKVLLLFLYSGNSPAFPADKQPDMLPGYIRAGLKTFVVGAIVLVALLPQLETNTPADGLTGAYRVERYEVMGKPITTCDAPVKRFFVHPSSYLVFQAQDDSLTSSHFIRQGNIMELTDYKGQTQIMQYSLSDGVLTLRSDSLTITGRAIPWQEMPALRGQFHLVVDEIR